MRYAEGVPAPNLVCEFCGARHVVASLKKDCEMRHLQEDG